LNEFELIRRYFARRDPVRPDVILGIGDDAALLEVPAGRQLALATDTLVEGIHVPAGTDPASIGHKALAVNLSDLAAMGAEPAWFTLNLTLPRAEAAWLEDFARGLFDLARAQGVQLVGGDTTHGPLTVTVGACGFVPPGQALTRAGARPGDRIYVSGVLGEAGLALPMLRGQLELPEEYQAAVLERFHRPWPRVREGLALRGLASACIDISDGLLADLGHVLEQSGVGARIDLSRLPVSPAYDTVFSALGWDTALAAGDDYELCFTLPPAREQALHRAAAGFAGSLSWIGEIEAEAGLRIMDEAGRPYRPARRGYDHFAAD
jgi:thiamine-monophosphate kinase